MMKAVEEIVVEFPLMFTNEDESLTFMLGPGEGDIGIATELNDITILIDERTFRENPERYLDRESELLARYFGLLKPYAFEVYGSYERLTRSAGDLEYMMQFSSEGTARHAFWLSKLIYSLNQLPRITTLKWDMIGHFNSYSLGTLLYSAMEGTFNKGADFFEGIASQDGAGLTADGLSNARECANLCIEIRHLYSMVAGVMRKRRDDTMCHLDLFYPGTHVNAYADTALPKPS